MKENVQLLNVMGDDKMIVDVARVSYEKMANDYSDDKNEGLIKFLIKHNHWCYDDKTEILTNSGWKLFNDLKKEDYVAQVYGWENEDFKFNFTKPNQIHKSFYSGEMYSYESNQLSYSVTPNHKMLVKTRNKSGVKDKWEIGTSNDLHGRFKKIRKSAKFESNVETNNLDYEKGWLYGFILGDGYQYSETKIGVRLKRTHKISELSNILHKLDVIYTKKICDNNVTQFLFDYNIKIGKANNKTIGIDFTKYSNGYLKGILMGYLFADGSIKRKGWVYSSSSNKLFKEIMLLCTYCGYNVNHKRDRHLDNPKHSINHIGVIQSNHDSNVDKRMNGAEKIVEYKGYVHCVTVDSGMVMVRRNGFQMVCGNTPFSHPQLQFRIKMPIYVERQLVKTEVGRVYNSISGRYVDFSDSYTLIPEGEWRKQSEDSKQGSAEPLAEGSQIICNALQDEIYKLCKGSYQTMISMGVSKEQARTILPLNLNTTQIWTGSLLSFIRLYKQRVKDDAQKETGYVVKEMMRQLKESGKFETTLKHYKV